MPHLFIFGLGYSAKRIRAATEARGWRVTATGKDGDLAFEDEERVRASLGAASHVLSSVPPAEAGDPVLARYGDALEHGWLGYLSSTGIYGNTRGAWVDESAPAGGGRRSARSEADLAWLGRGARVFRLPGIYGPGRNALERVREGRAHRIALPGQVFSRIHVDDIAQVLEASMHHPNPGAAYNVCDDNPCPPQEVIGYAAQLLGMPEPPAVPFEEVAPTMTPMALGFYSESKKVRNDRIKDELGVKLLYPDYPQGLAALLADGD
jgi:nucleoside-diphosphate-sugar epimerase